MGFCPICVMNTCLVFFFFFFFFFFANPSLFLPNTIVSLLFFLSFPLLPGLVWVLRYYYDGVASWNWFYPYHYAPLVSDLIQTTSFDFKFDLNAPFTPLAQLLGVLSPLSYKLLPKPYAELMTSPVSPLADLYPLEFEVCFFIF